MPRATKRLKSCSTKEFPITDDIILQNILSFVGKYHYRFVGSVNHHFRMSYVSLYPQKTTKINASTIKHAKLCLEDIVTCKKTDCEKKDQQLRLLWHSAAQYGMIDAVKYLNDWTKPMTKRTSTSMYRIGWPEDHFVDWKYAYCDPAIPITSELRYRYIDDWKYDLCYKAAEYGQLKLLQWATANRFYVIYNDIRVCQHAIGSENYDIDKWARANGFSWATFGPPNLQKAIFLAAEKGHLYVIKWLHLCHRGLDHEGTSDNDRTTCCNYAAGGGHLDVLQYLISIGCDLVNTSFVCAIIGDQVEVVKFFLEKGFPDEDGCCSVAARWGCMATLQLLHSSDFQLDDDVPAFAASAGHLDIIKWARDRGCPWSESACKLAAGYGQLDTLKWLHANGCPWDESTTKYASSEEIYVWATNNGCPIAEGNPRETLTISFLSPWETYINREPS